MLVFIAVLLMISFGLDVRTGMRTGGDVALRVEGQKISHRQYFDRYRLPVMHTETNRTALHAVEWLWKEWMNLLRLREDALRPPTGRELGTVTALAPHGDRFVSVFDVDRVLDLAGGA